MTSPRRLRAPREHGAVLADPSVDQVGQLLAKNQQVLASFTGDFLGRSWTDLREQARRELLEAAAAYHRSQDEPVPQFSSHRILMAGHQPELFHPGVWAKNFALRGLARRHEAAPVNLIVDNDTAKSAILKLPVRAEPEPYVGSIPFDHWSGEIPYEELSVQDEALFARLPEEAAPILQAWNLPALLPEFWSLARQQATPRIGERFAGARRALERRWGCHNLEVPVSWVCQTNAFAWFAGHLLTQLPRLHATYNDCLR